MLITEFLPEQQYYKYGDWMKSQDDEARHLYFGVAADNSIIDRLMLDIEANPNNHKFLIVTEDNQWVGTLHIAIGGTQVEFGLMVSREYRGRGIGGIMLEEALLWARNRGYKELFMHCLTWNQPIKHLCDKHGLKSRSMFGESEVQVEIPQSSWTSIIKEVNIRNRNIFHTYLQNSTRWYQEIYS
jgi:GNAT superfamily N-acetyltransferase